MTRVTWGAPTIAYNEAAAAVDHAPPDRSDADVVELESLLVAKALLAIAAEIQSLRLLIAVSNGEESRLRRPSGEIH
jgi:hypothetical protein